MNSTNYIFTIGINKYSSHYWKDLNNAVFDAKELSRILIEKYSFEEYPGNLYDNNATKENIYSAFTTLNQVVLENDSVIIFWGGHGNMDPLTKKGFWIPFDGTNDRSTWIENSSIKNFISDCPAKHILLIIDSCFSGTFLTTTRSANIERSYSDLYSKKSRWVISSGNEEKVSDGVPNKHSPFCKLVCDFLDRNENEYCCITELFNYTQVLISKKNKQTPQCNFISNIGHDDGELVFVLTENFKSSHNKTIGIPNSENLKRDYLANIGSESNISSGKEILIVKSIIDEYDFMIIENFRFNDNNEKKILFKDNLGIFDSTDHSESWEVIRRFATVSGLFNYIDKHPEIINKKTIFIRATDDIENVEDDLYCRYYSQYLTQLLNANTKKMFCLHCEEKITDNNSYLIEFDDFGYDAAVGNVHYPCLRPIDRILGKSIYGNLEKENYLINFDFEKWIYLLENGQGQITAIKNKMLDNIYIISWNHENNINVGSFCIKLKYDNGDSDFVMLGNKIQRFKESEVDYWVTEFSNSIQNYKPCKIVESGINGNLDIIEKIKEDNQSISMVISYEKTRYSNLLEKNQCSIINDYTPLCYFVDMKDEIISFYDIIPLISNPENIERYIDNWQILSPQKIDFKLKIVESDLELGSLIALYGQKGKNLVINPQFDIESKQLKAGYIIKTIEEIIGTTLTQKKCLRAGDKVNIIINPSAPKLPYGILLTDEFIDEEGESCSIFQPIENGQQLDLMYKMSTKLMKKV